MLVNKDHFCIVIFSLISICSFSNGELFTALADLSKSMAAGKDLAKDLHGYIKMEEERLNDVKRLAKRLEMNHINNTDEDKLEEHLANPINAYLVVKQLANDWKVHFSKLIGLPATNMDEAQETTQEYFGPQGNPDTKKLVYQMIQRVSMLPGDDDVSGAADAILRLQKTYALSVENLANGDVAPGVKSPELSAAQCLHIGARAYSLKDYAISEKWFLTALERLELEKDQDTIRPASSNVNPDILADEKPNAEIIYDNLSYAYGRQGLYKKALAAAKNVLLENPNNSRAERNKDFYENAIEQGEGYDTPKVEKKELHPYEQEIVNYEALCRDEQVFPEPADKDLYCEYYVPHVYYKYQPVKQEVLYPDPRIVMWYDIINDDEIVDIQKTSKSRLRRATVKNPITGVLEFADYRISKSSWLPYHLTETTAKINGRIEKLTGLSLDTAEDLQVVNYGIGGHYAPHFDFGRKRERDAFEINNGNRIATLIYYLTDVQAGGLTAFTRIGAKVRPKRGAAAFWWNLHRNGEGDLRTRHAACPVLAGSKWVMNKWFHERDQEFRRPCALERGEVEADEVY